MNLIDLTVTKVLGKPFQCGSKWVVNVMAEGYGAESPTDVMVDSEVEANQVTIGYRFLG